MRIFTFLCFSSLFLAGALPAQDTIFQIHAAPIEGKVLFVGEAIKYKRADNANGPVYSIPVSEVRSIHYSNGKTDTLFENVTPAAPPRVAIVKKEKIDRDGRTYSYQGQGVSEKKRIQIAARSHPDKILEHEILLVGKNQHRQYVSFITGAGMVITGLACGLAGMLYSASDDSDPGTFNAFVGTGTAFLTAGLCSEIISIFSKIKRSQHASRVVERYNAGVEN